MAYALLILAKAKLILETSESILRHTVLLFKGKGHPIFMSF